MLKAKRGYTQKGKHFSQLAFGQIAIQGKKAGADLFPSSQVT